MLSNDIILFREAMTTLLEKISERLQSNREKRVFLINNLDANANGLDLSAKIFESIAAKKISPTQKARNTIVKEFQMSIR